MATKKLKRIFAPKVPWQVSPGQARVACAALGTSGFAVKSGFAVSTPKAYGAFAAHLRRAIPGLCACPRATLAARACPGLPCTAPSVRKTGVFNEFDPPF